MHSGQQTTNAASSRPGDAAFVVFEGLDGAGTTTHARLLAEGLQGRDVQVCLTAEPSDGPIGQIARAYKSRVLDLDPRTAALTFTADRADHLARAIRPALQSGSWVVCDRYILSTLAYQGADGCDASWLLAISEGLDVPDLTILLDPPEDERAARVSSRLGADRWDDTERQRAIRDAYTSGADLLRRRGHRIDVVSSAGTVEDTHRAVVARVDSLGRTRLG